MAEPILDAAAAAPATPATPDPAPAAVPAAAPVRTALPVDDSGADADADAGGGSDWRKLIAGDDEKALKRLERFAQPQDFFKSYRDTENKLRAGAKLPTLPDDATPEEIAAHRKALGIPEKSDGYGLAFPQEMKPTEADTAALGAFADHMHAAGVPPAFVKPAFDFYMQTMRDGDAAKVAAAEEATLQSLGELRSEYKGREFGRNMKLADEYLMRYCGDDSTLLDTVNQVLDMRLPNGVKVMHSPYMKVLFKAARDTADDEALLGGDVANGGKSIKEEYDGLIKKSVTPGQKLTATEDAKMRELAGALTRQPGRRAA